MLSNIQTRLVAAQARSTWLLQHSVDAAEGAVTASSRSSLPSLLPYSLQVERTTTREQGVARWLVSRPTSSPCRYVRVAAVGIVLQQGALVVSCGCRLTGAREGVCWWTVLKGAQTRKRLIPRHRHSEGTGSRLK